MTRFFSIHSDRLSSGSRGGQGGHGPPSVPDKDYLLCTSWHFLVKKPYWPAKQWILWPLFYIFSKKIFSLTLLGMNIIHLSYSSLCSLFHSYFIFLCAYFYIIMTQAITFLACKDWSEVFLHTLLHKNVWELINILYKIVLKFQLKVLMIVGRYIFWS